MKKHDPPKFADWIFKWYCRNGLRESILGDLHEQFYQDLEQKGSLRAKFIYWITVLKFFNRFTINRGNSNKNNHLILKGYFQTPFRFLIKNKSYTLINVVGLSIGLFGCLLIFYFLHHELTFDRQHEGNNIYRINTIYADNSGNQTKMVNTPPMLVPGIRGVYPEVEKATQLRYTLRTSLRNENRVFYEDYGFYADSSFLEIFEFPLVSGNRKNALDEPNSIVITSSLAKKYFGDQDPMGKNIIMNNDMSLRVTGVLKPIPSNSHLKFDFLVSFSTYVVPDGYASDLTSWSWLGFITYVQLSSESDHLAFQKKLDDLFTSLSSPNSTPYKTIVQPLRDIYLGSTELVDDLASHIRMGSKYSIYSLAIIALLILFIACFNLMNLTTAIGITRAKEIGIKKILGVEKHKLITQLILESVLITFLSALLAYLIGISIFPQVKELLAWDLELNGQLVLLSIPVVLIFILLLGVFSGLYPSLLLANLKAPTAIKQGRISNSGSQRFSNGLIGFQFIIAVALIASTITIHNQVQHLRSMSLGFQSEDVVAIKLLRQDMGRYFEKYKQRLLQNSQIQSVSRSERIVGDPWPVNSILVDGYDPSEYKQVTGNLVDYDFLETIGIALKNGRAFSKNFAADSLNSIIINESCATLLGLEDPVGTQVNFFSFNGPRTIIGVMEDFNFSSLHNEIGPAVVILPFIDLEYLYVKVTPGSISERLDLIEDHWNEITNDAPLEMQLMDDHLSRLYKSEEKLSFLITGFSILAVSLACLGLYGLIAFVVNKKLKEVGIRKVLGASVASLLLLFSKRFIKLITVSTIIAAPLIHQILSIWLDNYAYRIEFRWGTLAIAAILLTVITLITISYQTLKTVLQNPVNVLRDE